MRSLPRIADALAGRRRSLLARLERMEAEIERFGSESATTREALCARYPAFDEVSSAERHEFALIESALRRIAAREYQYCITCGQQISLERLSEYPYAVNCERCTRGFGAEYEGHLRAQHVSLRELVGCLSQAMDSLIEARGSDPVALLASRLLVADLSRLLPEHFELEERGGYFAEVLQAAPRFSRRAGVLQEQHAVLAAWIARLDERAREAAAHAPEWAAIAGEFREFAEALIAHEREEGLLTREAFSDDVGTAD